MLRIHQHKADTDKEHKEAEKKAVSLRKEIQNQSRVIEDLRNQVGSLFVHNLEAKKKLFVAFCLISAGRSWLAAVLNVEQLKAKSVIVCSYNELS